MKYILNRQDTILTGLPPCGGSGLKFRAWEEKDKQRRSPSVWREWIEISSRETAAQQLLSPSVWREWIEMFENLRLTATRKVSLRVEGVD